MIQHLRSIAIFATVVDHGTFRAAARHLGLAPSRVSETVSELEKALGVTLLYRSTRQLSLTQEGRILHDRAKDMLAAAEAGLDEINPLSRDPVGLLRVSAPAFVTQTDLVTRLADFAKAYPGVRLDLHFTDQRLNLIGEGFDVAIRAGWLEDSELRTRKIGASERLLVASPSYVARHKPPTEAADLEDWDWIRFSMVSDRTHLTGPSGKTTIVTGRSQISVNAAVALYEFALRGVGVTAIPKHLADQALARGDLVHVLPDWTLEGIGVYAVWPDQSRRENLTTTFVRYLAAAQIDQ